MNISCNTSDKSYKWSDYETSCQYLSSSKTQAPLSTSSGYWSPSASRLSHRNLQTLRQTHLQMSKGQRSWPQILSFNQLSGPEAQDDLCPQRTKRSSSILFEQSSGYEVGYGTNQRNQSRVACAARVILNVFSYRHHYRRQRCRSSSCQYGVGFFSGQAQHGGRTS